MFSPRQWENLKQIWQLTRELDVDAFVVGGAIRDLLQGNNPDDLDLVLSRRVVEIARSFADKIDGSLVKLDQDRGIYRVVEHHDSYDFTQLRGKSIQEDLQERDFTINAMAYPLYKLFQDEENILEDGNNSDENLIIQHLIDPHQGCQDLKLQQLKEVKGDIFKEDPLRIWRAIRLKGRLDLTIIDSLKGMICDYLQLAKKPAPERIRGELLKIFSLASTADLIKDSESDFGLAERNRSK